MFASFPKSPLSWVSATRVLVTTLILWSGFFVSTGTLSSGYHFIDDHRILTIGDQLERDDIVRVTSEQIQGDVQRGRFKPVGMAHFTLQVKLFKDNLFLWSLYRAFLGVITSFCLFFFVRMLKYSVIESTLFTFLSLVGPHATIWWKLGPSESTGMFFLSLSLLFMAWSTIREDKRIFSVLFVCFAVLMAMSKENFLFFIFAIIFWRFWLFKDKYNCIKKSLRHSFAAASVLVFLGCSELVFILLYVGTDKVGYAGYSGLNIIQVSKAAFSLFMASHGWIVMVAAVLFLGFQDQAESRLSRLRRMGNVTALFLIITLPQTVIYAKSDMYFNYFQPGILGFSFLIVYMLRLSRERSWDMPRLDVSFWLKTILVLGSSACLLGLYIWTHDESLYLLLRTVVPEKKYLVGTVDLFRNYMLFFGFILILFSSRTLYSKQVYFGRQKILMLLVVLGALANLGRAYYHAGKFTMDGKYTNIMLASLGHEVTKKSRILIVSHPLLHFEETFSMKHYISHKIGLLDVSFFPIYAEREIQTDFHRNLLESFLNELTNSKSSASNLPEIGHFDMIIFFSKQQEDMFLSDPVKSFNPDHHKRRVHENGFVCYSKMVSRTLAIQ